MSIPYTPLPPPKTHQRLIHRIKQSLSLPHLHSSFLSRANLLLYLHTLHTENQLLRASLNPPSLSPEILALQKQCTQLYEILGQMEAEEGRLVVEVRGLEEQLGFLREYESKGVRECEEIEEEIGRICEENSVEREGGKSRSSQSQQISKLMDRFMGYFQQQQEDSSGSSPSKMKQSNQRSKFLTSKSRSAQNIDEKISIIKNQKKQQQESQEISSQNLPNLKQASLIPQFLRQSYSYPKIQKQPRQQQQPEPQPSPESSHSHQPSHSQQSQPQSHQLNFQHSVFSSQGNNQSIMQMQITPEPKTKPNKPKKSSTECAPPRLEIANYTYTGMENQ